MREFLGNVGITPFPRGFWDSQQGFGDSPSPNPKYRSKPGIWDFPFCGIPPPLSEPPGKQFLIPKNDQNTRFFIFCFYCKLPERRPGGELGKELKIHGKNPGESLKTEGSGNGAGQSRALPLKAPRDSSTVTWHGGKSGNDRELEGIPADPRPNHPGKGKKTPNSREKKFLWDSPGDP